LDIGPWTLDLAHCSLHIAPCTLLLGHCSLHLALASLGVQAPGRLARWGCSIWGRATCCSGESMRNIVLLFFCSLVSRLSSAHQAIPGRPEISQGERTPRTHDLQMPPDRIKSPIPPPELSNNGGELGPRLSCSSASRLSSSRLSPDGPWTGYCTGVNDVVGGPRRSGAPAFQERVGRWLAPPFNGSTCSHLAPWNRSCLFLH
jgi:hypothetical protein